MLQIHSSNRLEVLLDRMALVLGEPLADPLTPERIVVQHPSMGRWVAQELARRTGIAANLELPLPAEALWDLLRHWHTDLPEGSQWQRGPLTWRLFALLQELDSDPDLQAPSLYLAGDRRELKTYQLARRIADLFDQYLIYRPALVLGWEAGQAAAEQDSAAHWQARLWRELAARIGNRPEARHRAALFRSLELCLERGQPPQLPLPERLLLFGLSTLPPVYGRLLARLGHHLPIHLFVLSPCREYWADLVDEGRLARARARDLARGGPQQAALLDLGNPLLASWGRVGKTFQDALIELGGEETADYREPPPDRLLGLLQSDLLDARDRRAARPCERILLEAKDQSLLIHACHGPQREVQVLHDRLLRLFEEVRDLRPRDILVMAPDIDGYAPHIEAVFGAVAPGDPRSIPYAIADRRLAAEHPLLAAFQSLLALPESRLGASEVLGWLGVPAIARRFRLDLQALERVRTWVAETGIRWGEDGAMRARLGLPEEDANTWRFGLRRLFLGYALPPEERLHGTLQGAVLPYPDLEGPEAEALGGLQGLLDTLGRWRADLDRPRPLREWAESIKRLMADLMEPDESEEELLQPLRQVLDQLMADAEAAGFDGPLGAEVIRAELDSWLATGGAAQRFLSARVTFCNMVPMRSIPARVLCLLGLNGSDFPRDQRPLGFDLMARDPLPGDRSRRDDDRQLFLEALLSAREHLHLSYVGRDQRDNSTKTPSVLIEELLAYIQGAFRAPDGVEVTKWLVIEHPLQPFSRRYYDGSDPRLYSYREDWCRAAQSRAEPGSDCFAPAPLKADPAGRSCLESEAAEGEAPAIESLEIEDLIRLLRSPAAWFLCQVLGLRGPDRELVLEESEPFVPDALEDWTLRQRLLRLAEQGRATEAPDLLRASGLLPHGAAGTLTLTQASERVAAFRQRLAPWLPEVLEPLELDLEAAGVRLVGWLRGLTPGGLVAQRLGRIRASDRLELWVRHLALNLAQPPGVAPESVLVSEEETWRLRPVADAPTHLADLIGLFRQGRLEPLPFFPETSLAFALHGWGNQVESAWEGHSNGRRGERDLPEVRTAFRGRAPLAHPFPEIAERVFGPLVATAHEEAQP